MINDLAYLTPNGRKHDFSASIDVTLTIQLWIFAECGIGGLMHGLHIPFTGIIVGSLAIYCIYLLALSQDTAHDIRRTIATATITVLLIKILLTPFAPIQAYFATAFQGMMGYLIFSCGRGQSWNFILMALICLGESAIQKVLVAYFLFGTAFFDAIDKASASVFDSFGMDFQGSLIVFIWIFYIGLHLLTAVIIGSIVPKLIITLKNIEIYNSVQIRGKTSDYTNKSTTQPWQRLAIKIFWVGLVLLVLLLIGQLYVVGTLGILLRFVLFSLLLTLSGKVFSVIFKKKNSIPSIDLHQEIDHIRQTGMRFKAIYHWSRSEYNGCARWKYFLMGIMAIPFNTTKRS